jgi:hypothetical protein
MLEICVSRLWDFQRSGKCSGLKANALSAPRI